MERIVSDSQKTQTHIVLFISALRKGGAERVMVNLADYLQEDRRAGDAGDPVYLRGRVCPPGRESPAS